MDNENIVGTSFCNSPHRLRDGAPVDHPCFVLDPAKLRAERDHGAASVEGSMKRVPERQHPGVKVPTAWAIKVRKRGEKAFWFLKNDGGMTRLRIHAPTYRDRAVAEKACATDAAANPEFEFKVVAF